MHSLSLPETLGFAPHSYSFNSQAASMGVKETQIYLSRCLQQGLVVHYLVYRTITSSHHSYYYLRSSPTLRGFSQIIMVISLFLLTAYWHIFPAYELFQAILPLAIIIIIIIVIIIICTAFHFQLRILHFIKFSRDKKCRLLKQWVTWLYYNFLNIVF